MKHAVAVMLFILLVGAPSMTALAQDEDIEPKPASSSFLPDAIEIGDDWVEIRRYGLDLPTDLFREGSAATYGGPQGARIAVLAFLTTDTQVAVRRSWEAATERFDSYRYAVASDYDYGQVEVIDAMPPPPGCAESRRAEGTDDKFGVVAGLTMCAIDPDVIVIVVVSGEAMGTTGTDASDTMISLSVAAP